MKNLQRGFAPLIIVLVIAIVAIAGGIYTYSKREISNNTNSQPINAEQKTKDAVQKPSISQVDLNTTNSLNATEPVTTNITSKIYTNQKLGISINIPESWNVVEEGFAPVSIMSTSNDSTQSEIVMSIVTQPYSGKDLDSLLNKINSDNYNALLDKESYKKLTILKKIQLKSGPAYILNGGQFYGIDNTGITLIAIKNSVSYMIIA